MAEGRPLLGHRLLVLREHGRWLHCRSWDGYLGWVHRGYLMRVSEGEARGWESGVDGELCLSLGVKMLDDGGLRVRLLDHDHVTCDRDRLFLTRRLLHAQADHGALPAAALGVQAAAFDVGLVALGVADVEAAVRRGEQVLQRNPPQR